MTRGNYLIRHCLTEYNRQHRLQGKTDIPLSDYGVRQAKENRSNLDGLNIELIVASDLLRAQQTAEIYADYLGLEVNLDAGLQELDHGDWEGRSIDELHARTEYAHWLENPATVPIPGVNETPIEAAARLESTYTRWRQAHREKNLLFVMHKHAKALLLSQLNHRCIDFFPRYNSDSILPYTIDETLR